MQNIKNMPLVNILIPFKDLKKFTIECVNECKKLNYPNFKIVLLPDSKIKEETVNEYFKDCKIIVTGNCMPGKKRNIGIKNTKADIYAFIDDDAYPHKNWLYEAVKIFKEDNEIGAVGGPNSTPHNTTYLEKSAINSIYSILGVQSAYYIKKYKQDLYECKELASSNLIVKREVLNKINGYPSNLLLGEDTVLGKRIRNIDYKIIYSPKVIVYHHRRPLFKPCLIRTYEQAANKAVLLQKFNSINDLIFLIPSSFFVYNLISIPLSIYNPTWAVTYLLSLIIYSCILIIDQLYKKNIITLPLIPLGVFLIHNSYGLGFLRGLIFKNKKIGFKKRKMI